MAETRSTRAFAVDLEIRGDGRTIAGLCAPFDSPTEIADYSGVFVETIQRGAFARTIAERGPERVKLLVQHATESLPIGRATMLREDRAGLVGEFRVSSTSAGDDTLELIRDGALDGLSIGFRVVREQWAKASRERSLLEVALHEVSVVSWPAYDSARVSAVRSAAPVLAAALRRLSLVERT